MKMDRAVFTLLLLAWATPSHEQQKTPPSSPCPNVFNYEPLGDERDTWYGVVILTTDSTLRSFWLNIVLDSRANLIGNWIGQVTTDDNMDFKIETTNMQINPGEAVTVRFFVRYNETSSAPKLKAIKLNGREICNVDRLQPVLYKPDSEIRQSAAQAANNNRIISDINSPRTQQTPPRPQPNTIADLSQIWPDTSRSIDSRPLDTSTNTNRTTPSTGNSKNDFFMGGIPILYIPRNPTNPNGRHQCGKVALNRNPLVVKGKPTLAGQWPWQIALYQAQTVDYKYICGGTLVTRRHVVTAAHCVTLTYSRRLVDPGNLMVFLGKHNLRTFAVGTQVKFVENIKINPLYNETHFLQDLAILDLTEPVTYSDWVQPACLWPDNQVDLKNIVGRIGSVVGWGFDETGTSTEDLNLVEMPVVDSDTCLRSNGEFFVRFTSFYTYCAGYRDGTSVCNGDSGSGMVFEMDNSWYLRGLVSLAVARQNENQCDPSHYVIFTDIAKLLPWVKENINDY